MVKKHFRKNWVNNFDIVLLYSRLGKRARLHLKKKFEKWWFSNNNKKMIKQNLSKFQQEKNKIVREKKEHFYTASESVN